MPPLRIGILVSGNGSNLQAILDAIGQKRLNASVEIVLSDNSEAYALKRAQSHQIPFQVVLRKDFPDRLHFERALLEALRQNHVEWVVLAGFMRILSPNFLQTLSHKVLNIHPSLLPSFPGLDAIEQAWNYGVKITGCTVHFVDEGCDTGPIIAQSAVEILPEDTLATLTEKIHREEHRIYPEVLELIAKGRVKVEGRAVILENR